MLAASASDADGGRALEDFLLANSGLPGPRGNLELAAAFADCYVDRIPADWEHDTLERWAGISAEEAPYGTSGEYLPFCAMQALSSLYQCTGDAERRKIASILRWAAADKRWRLRESCAMALQRIGEMCFSDLLEIVQDWERGASLLELRALIAALAHPPLLRDPDKARLALDFAGSVMLRVQGLSAEEDRTDELRVLKQGLEYALSVYVAALPDDGFDLLDKWAVSPSKSIRQIVKANLGKSRLSRFEDRIRRTLALLLSDR